MAEHKRKVITIVGAESSGKTTLARQLREHFDCPWVPEFAREYLVSLGKPYTKEDLEIIAERQLKTIQDTVRQPSASLAPYPLAPTQISYGAHGKGTPKDLTPEQTSLKDQKKSKIENRMLRPANPQPNATAQQPSKIIFVDGGMMNLRMWMKIKYKSTIPIVEKALQNDVTDLYLLCRPHEQWEADPLREAPSLIDRVWIYNQYLEELTRGEKPMEILGGLEKERLALGITLIENMLIEK